MAPELEVEKLKQTSEDHRAAAVEYARMIHERTIQSLTASKDYAVFGLRSILLLNGGAIIAILTLIGAAIGTSNAEASTLSPRSFVPAFAAYTFGLILAVLAMLTSFINFQTHLTAFAKPSALASNIKMPGSEWPSEYDRRKEKKIIWTRRVAIYLSVASLGAFLVGGIFVLCVFLNQATLPS
jgi:hypothetical protein